MADLCSCVCAGSRRGIPRASARKASTRTNVCTTSCFLSRRVCVEGHYLGHSLRQSFALLSEGLVQGRARSKLKSGHTRKARSSGFTALPAGIVHVRGSDHGGMAGRSRGSEGAEDEGLEASPPTTPHPPMTRRNVMSAPRRQQATLFLSGSGVYTFSAQEDSYA